MTGLSKMPLSFARACAQALIVWLLLALPAWAVDIQRVQTPAGIEAWLVEDHTVPLIALNFSLQGGAAQDPEGQEGLTRLLSTTLDEGAGDYTSAAFQARMEELAINIGFSTGKDHFYGSLRTLTATRDDAFDLLSLAVNKPRFDDDAVERMKAQLISQARQRAQSPDAVAGLTFVKTVLGNHPYARPTGGAEKSLAPLTPQDLARQHQRLFARSGLKIGVVGAIDAETLGPLLDKIFASLPETGDLTPIEDVVPTTGGHVEKQLPVPQTTLMFGLEGLKRTDPDYQAAFVMNHILGGGSFTSWLYQEVREKRGLTYSIGTSISPYDHTAFLLGSAATRPDQAGEALKIIQSQFERMAKDGPTEQKLDSAKRFLTGSYPLRFDTSGKIASQLVALQNADLGIDYFDRRNSEIEAVTLDDVRRVTQRLLGDKQLTVVSVSPANPVQN